MILSRGKKFLSGEKKLRVLVGVLCLELILLSGCLPSAVYVENSPSPTNTVVAETEVLFEEDLQQEAENNLADENTPLPDLPENNPTVFPTKTETAARMPTLTPTEDTRPTPKYWREWPIIPLLSARSLEIYQNGLQMGNDPAKFSVIGDCQSEPDVFLGIYETDRYWLGEAYQYLSETIEYYAGSFSRQSLSVKGGMSASTALSSLWADQEVCDPQESPVECELRITQPSIVFINLGTNWRADASTEPYERYLRQIVDLVIAHGTLPVLMNKADNVEGDFSINLITARVAYDYDIPMLNFWRAVQPLEHHGLDESTHFIYLTPDGWDRRNFVALQTLDSLRRELDDALTP